MSVDECRKLGLDAVFAPKSIAVFSGTTEPGTIGGRTLKYLKSFAGPIWWIGPDGDHPSLDAVPGSVDQSILNLPPDQVLAAAKDCIAKGVRAIILYSGGFADAGEEGRAAQEQLAALCQSSSVRLLGPNSAGVVSVGSGIYSTYSQSIEAARPRHGTIAMVTQSGAVGTFALAKGVERGLGFSRFVATGNEADIDIAECIEWLADDAETKVILVYLEAAANGPRLLRAISKASSVGKPVIVLKGGTSETGAAAAASHTGKLAGSDRIYSTALHTAGACRVTSIEEMMDLAYACSHASLPQGNRMAVITGSGGIGVMMADDAGRFGLVLPPLSEKTKDSIRTMLPLAGVLNPIDTTGQILNDFTLLPQVVETVLGNEAIDIVTIFLASVGLDQRLSTPLNSALIKLREGYPQTVIAVCMMATEAVRSELEEAGILVFDEPSRLIRLLAGMTRFRHGTLSAASKKPSPAPLPSPPWDEAAARNILEQAGIPFPPFIIAQDRAGAEAAALKLGQAVVLKVVSPDIAHKSDCGGVALNVAPADAGAEYDAMLARLQDGAPGARIQGVGISPMIEGGVETVLGIQHDPVFGPVLMFGLGGIHVESLDDVVFRLAPITHADAEEMIDGIRALPILMGARGKPAADRAVLAEMLMRLSDFAVTHAHQIESIEINPFLALEQGGVALDALIIPKEN